MACGPLAIPPPAAQRPRDPLVRGRNRSAHRAHGVAARGVARGPVLGRPRGVHPLRALRDPRHEPLLDRRHGGRDHGSHDRLLTRVPPHPRPRVGRRPRCRHHRLEPRCGPVFRWRRPRRADNSCPPTRGGCVASPTRHPRPPRPPAHEPPERWYAFGRVRSKGAHHDGRAPTAKRSAAGQGQHTEA